MVNPKGPPTAEPSVNQTLREFRQLMDERLRAEMARARRGRIVGWIALVFALIAAVATAGLLYYAFYHDLPLLASPSLRAQEIVLVDGAGTDRGYWRVEPDGAARLVMLDGEGNARLKLTLNADGDQALALADGAGTNRVVLSQLLDQSGTLAFADERGTTRTVLGMSANAAASLLFADANGGTRAALGLSPNGEPTFWWPELEDGSGSQGGSR